MEKQKKGIKISLVTIIMLAFVVVICALLVVSNIQLDNDFETVVEFDNYYKQCNYKADQMEKYIDELQTNMVNIVEKGDPTSYMKAYFSSMKSDEAAKLTDEVKKTTDALDNLDEDTKSQLVENCKYLEKAKPAYDKLSSKYDLKIMKYMYEYYQKKELEGNEKRIDSSKFPEEIVNMVTLSASELKKTPEQFRESARAMLYSDSYTSDMKNINANINNFSDRIKVFADENLEQQQNQLGRGIVMQQIYCIVMIVGMVVIVLILYKLVITVLRHYVRQIISTTDLKPEGVYELRYLADAYNEKFEKIEKKEQSLIRRADYDSLTNIYNRGAFETAVNNKLKEINDNTSAFVLFDVDNFKKVNEDFGHEMGDKILSLISYTLQESFGENDILGRISGDEFGVFIPSVPEEDLSYVKERVANINRQMSAPNASFPSITFSVGISLNFQGDTFKDAYGRADDALFYVKSHGRCGCRIYGSNS